MIVLAINCNVFIVLPIRLKTCRSNGFFGFLQGKMCASEKLGSVTVGIGRSIGQNLNNDLPMDLYRLCFISPIKRSCCPPHHGALEMLNFQIILSLLKKSWNFSFLLMLFNHFASVLKVFALSEYITFGFSSS